MRFFNIKLLYIYVMLAGMLFFSGCMHKSLQHDVADDVADAIIYEDDEAAMLITHETIFQASSKSADGGVISISGHDESRISCYDVNTGKLLARKTFGKRTKKAIILLGATEKHIWFYSSEPQLGIHARDPRTLEVNVLQEHIFHKQPALQSRLAKDDWYKMDSFYALDKVQGKLIVTDQQGYRWFIDCKTYAVEAVPQEYTFPERPRHDYLSSNAELLSGKYIYLSGEFRKIVKYGTQELSPDISFLDGKFVIDKNKLRIFTSIKNEHDSMKIKYDSLKAQWEAIESKSPPPSKAYVEYDHYMQVRQEWPQAKSDFEKIDRLYQEMTVKNRFPSKNYLLQAGIDSFFIVHRTALEKDARMKISRVQISNGQQLEEVWQTKIDRLFFDYNQARQTDNFKIVYSKGYPQFNFQFFDVASNRLVIIYMLHALSLDIDSGRILWLNRL